MEDHETSHDTQGHSKAKTSRHDSLRPACLAFFMYLAPRASPLLLVTDSIPPLPGFSGWELGCRCLPRLPRMSNSCVI